MARLRVILASLVAVATVAPSPSFAGGWAVTTLDPVPEVFVAGETYRIGFTVRQHGETLFVGARSAIEIVSQNSLGERFPAVPEGGPGHYVADVRFPEAGEWQWRVDQWPFAPQALGTVRVESAPAAAHAFVLDPSDALVFEVPTAPHVADGATLFHTRGCIGCHHVSDKGLRSNMGFGPDLNGIGQRASLLRPELSPADYVRESVRNPQAFRASGSIDGEMPVLPIDDAELEAVIEFLLR